MKNPCDNLIFSSLVSLVHFNFLSLKLIATSLFISRLTFSSLTLSFQLSSFRISSLTSFRHLKNVIEHIYELLANFRQFFSHILKYFYILDPHILDFFPLSGSSSFSVTYSFILLLEQKQLNFTHERENLYVWKMHGVHLWIFQDKISKLTHPQQLHRLPPTQCNPRIQSGELRGRE